MSFLKKKKGIIITAVVAFLFGIIWGSSGITQEELDSVNKNLKETKQELVKTKQTVAILEDKVIQAKPFFDMTDAEKETMKIEAQKKAEENKKEEERVAQEKAKADEAKKKEELEARSVTLGNGAYLVGKDIPAGVYDLYAVKGGGNVMSARQVNVIMGVKGSEDFYQREQQNVALQEGSTIELKSVTVKFVPDDGYTVGN